MKKFLVACLILVSSTAVLTSCGSGETKAAYQCPMKCEGEKTYDAAGKCPKCGMDMVELKK